MASDSGAAEAAHDVASSVDASPTRKPLPALLVMLDWSPETEAAANMFCGLSYAAPSTSVLPISFEAVRAQRFATSGSLVFDGSVEDIVTHRLAPLAAAVETCFVSTVTGATPLVVEQMSLAAAAELGTNRASGFRSIIFCGHGSRDAAFETTVDAMMDVVKALQPELTIVFGCNIGSVRMGKLLLESQLSGDTIWVAWDCVVSAETVWALRYCVPVLAALHDVRDALPSIEQPNVRHLVKYALGLSMVGGAALRMRQQSAATAAATLSAEAASSAALDVGTGDRLMEPTLFFNDVCGAVHTMRKALQVAAAVDDKDLEKEIRNFAYLHTWTCGSAGAGNTSTFLDQVAAITTVAEQRRMLEVKRAELNLRFLENSIAAISEVELEPATRTLMMKGDWSVAVSDSQFAAAMFRGWRATNMATAASSLYERLNDCGDASDTIHLLVALLAVCESYYWNGRDVRLLGKLAPEERLRPFPAGALISASLYPLCRVAVDWLALEASTIGNFQSIHRPKMPAAPGRPAAMIWPFKEVHLRGALQRLASAIFSSGTADSDVYEAKARSGAYEFPFPNHHFTWWGECDASDSTVAELERCRFVAAFRWTCGGDYSTEQWLKRETRATAQVHATGIHGQLYFTDVHYGDSYATMIKDPRVKAKDVYHPAGAFGGQSLKDSHKAGPWLYRDDVSKHAERSTLFPYDAVGELSVVKKDGKLVVRLVPFQKSDAAPDMRHHIHWETQDAVIEGEAVDPTVAASPAGTTSAAATAAASPSVATVATAGAGLA